MAKGSRAGIRKALFVALLFSQPDKTDAASAREAGFCPNGSSATLQKCAQKLKRDPWVQQQIAERTARALRRAQFDADKALGRLTDIADATMDEYADLLTSHDPYTALATMDRRKAAAIEAMQVEWHPDGTHKKTSIKLYSALEATRLVGTHYGLRLAGRQIVTMGGDAEPGNKARMALGELLNDLDRDDLAAFRAVVERLKGAEQRRLARTVDGEAEEVDGEAEEGEAAAGEEDQGDEGAGVDEPGDRGDEL